METKEDTKSSKNPKKTEDTDNVENEGMEDKNMCEDISEDKTPEIGGIAGLLGKTATILGALVQKEEEAPKTSLPAEHVETYKAAFNDFDHNKDGHISTQELHLSFRRAGLNPSEEAVQDIINEVDQDGSGKVEWPEFASVLATLLEAEKDEEENYKETFRVFSKDDEGCIPAQEMKFVLSQICSMEEAEEIMGVVDRNGDGVISYSEFRCMMGANPILL